MTKTTNITPLRLITLYEVSRKINLQLNLEKLLDEIMDQAIALLHAEKGLVLLRKGNSEKLSVQVARAMDKQSIMDTATMSHTVIKKVEEKGEPVLIQKIPDIQTDNASKSMVMYRLKSIVCVPLRSKRQLIGAIYLDTSRSEHFFKEEDVTFLEAFANLAGIAIENAKSYQEIENLNANLEKKVAERTAELRAKNSELSDAYQKLSDAQLQLIRTEKMASLGQLVAGVAHEINNPLGSLKSNMDNFIRGIDKIKTALEKTGTQPKPQSNEKLYQTLNLLQDLSLTNKLACERIYDVVKALRNFARLDEEEFKAVDIHEGIDNTLILLEHEFRDRIEIIKDYGDLPELYCQAAQINQVFMNIIANACESIKNRGAINIKTRLENNFVEVEIRDTGVGIRKENLEKIFDPGFTTKGVQVGVGLGLSICYKIIEDHGGSTRVESIEGQGTTFLIRLPWKQR